MTHRVPLALAVGLLCLLSTASLHAVTCTGTLPAVNPDSDYTDHLDGTVTHKPTGLMWKQCSEGQTWSVGACTGKSVLNYWSYPVTWARAEDESFAGHDDWRLPSVNELHSLVETCRRAPAINNDVFPGSMFGDYLSASPYAANTNSAWAVSFSDGNVRSVSRGTTAVVRLVRGGHSFASFDSRLDYTPDALADFTAVSNAAASTVTSSTDSKTLAGLTTVTGIKIEGEGSPQYRVGSGDWTGAPGAVANGDEINVRLTAGAVGSTRVATLTVGGETAAFSVSVSGEEGVCGAANGVATLLPPTADLCASGAPGAVSSVDGGHAWSCEGTGSGSATAQCGAPGADTSGAGGSGSATFELISSDGDACVVESAHLVAPPAGLPAGASLPFGALEFALNSCTPGGSATVQISYDTPVAGLVYWKYINEAWTTMPATLAGNTATFTIVDGGPFDADGTENGRIEDPSGPGVQPLSHGGSTPIPTLSQWMLAALAMALLLMVAVRRSRRQ